MNLFITLLCIIGIAAMSPAAAHDAVQEEATQEEHGEAEESKTVETHHSLSSSEEEAFEMDAWLVAEKFRWDINDTREHLRNQDKFGALVSELFEALSEKGNDVYAGSAMARNPGEEATIWIKGKVPAYVNDMVRRFTDENKLPVRIVDGMRFSVTDQERRMDRISEALEKQGFEGVGAAMRPGDVIHVSMLASDRFPETPVPQDSLAIDCNGEYVDPAAQKLLPDSIDRRGIYFTFTNEPIDVDEHARGGRQVYSGTGQCTSGFSVERISDSRNGIATAAHCTGISNFNAESPEPDFALFHRGEHCGDHGDVEWKSSSHFELAEYWASPTNRRDVNSRETWYSVNNVYCVFSRMTGTRSCDRVYSASVTQKGSSGACNGVKAKRLVAMDEDNTVGGDSGGPWSFGTEAAGIHKGDKWIWFGTRNTFTKASRLDEALGVRIRTK
ncbi:MAG: hypothetical protein R3348_07945 [Xanthomonadales bacterium]|nr:hypothetical protein [Xanthomonadales bacterium]